MRKFRRFLFHKIMRLAEIVYPTSYMFEDMREVKDDILNMIVTLKKDEFNRKDKFIN